MKKFSFTRTTEYVEWMNSLDAKWRTQVTGRLSRIEYEGHFGHLRNLGEGLAELKFNIGIRVYFIRTGSTEITLLNGGTKHGQDKDIKIAKKLASQI
jgi:putative addiction module killer protein